MEATAKNRRNAAEELKSFVAPSTTRQEDCVV
jgi:hypothetical protein